MARTGTLEDRVTGYEPVIGLEVHVELATRSKMFCACPVEFGAPPNSRVCPVCLGLPGSLPVPNRRAVELAVKAALALNCRINARMKFDRKNYHYPDLPKGYQISQYDEPLAVGGSVTIQVDGVERRIGIRRLHLEEDAGKSLHDAVRGGTLVDFNRAGVPLIEIVSEPDLRSPEEARLYLLALRNILLYTGVSDVRMEEGSLRCDANISVRPKGSREFGALTEVKNMNSFRSVYRALAYEAQRQAEVLASGGRVERETRHWDEEAGRTVSSRSKEEAHDYRYFPEPDLVPLHLEESWVEALRRQLPELPAQRAARYREQLGLPAYDAEVLVADKALADFFEATVHAGADAKAAANWLMGELLGHLNATGRTLADVPLTPQGLAGLLALIDAGTISGTIAKAVFGKMLDTGREAADIVREEGLQQISDEGELAAVVDRVVAQNPAVVADYRAGKEKAIGYLVGQVMKETRGKANPAKVNELLRAALR